MAVGPNFTNVERTTDKVRVCGESGDNLNDIVDIQVVLAQGDRIERTRVLNPGSVWDVEFPSDCFESGDATAFGWETRRNHLTTTSWVEAVKIPKPGGEP